MKFYTLNIVTTTKIIVFCFFKNIFGKNIFTAACIYNVYFFVKQIFYVFFECERKTNCETNIKMKCEGAFPISKYIVGSTH